MLSKEVLTQKNINQIDESFFYVPKNDLLVLIDSEFEYKLLFIAR